jgi:hypothetical protein
MLVGRRRSLASHGTPRLPLLLDYSDRHLTAETTGAFLRPVPNPFALDR